MSFRLKPNSQAKQHHVSLSFPSLTSLLFTWLLHTIPGCVPDPALYTDGVAWLSVLTSNLWGETWEQNIFIYERRFTEAWIKIPYTHPSIFSNHFFLVGREESTLRWNTRPSHIFTYLSTSRRNLPKLICMHAWEETRKPKETQVNTGRTCETPHRQMPQLRIESVTLEL